MPTPRESKLPRTVLLLGLVSLLMDVSSEMIHAVLPLFLVTVVGASPLVLGVIEGVAQATALLARFFSGALSDLMPRRKPLVLIGYLASALAKPLFALAGTASMVAVARISDRIGKGIRGAPRDALIADVTPPTLRGAAFGLRQALDTVGAVIGPLIALLLLALMPGRLQFIFWIAAIPAGLCVLMLWLGVTEPPDRSAPATRLSQNVRLPASFWRVVMIGGMLQLARFSDAFVILYAEFLDWNWTWIPLVLVIINISYAATSYPAGKLSDRYGRAVLLIPGIVLLVLADLIIAMGTSTTLIIGALVWGAHLGCSSGVLSAMVTDASAPEQRGTAFGLFDLASGVAILLASVLAGVLWQWFGPQSSFLAGAALASIALALACLPTPTDRPDQ